MVKVMYGVQFSDGSWHSGYDWRTDCEFEATLGEFDWAKEIVDIASRYSLDPRIVPVLTDYPGKFRCYFRHDGNYPNHPLTPLALLCELSDHDKAHKHWPYND